MIYDILNFFVLIYCYILKLRFKVFQYTIL